MDIIFMGTPDYAEYILQRLIDTPSINVTAVYTQPDKPVGRKKLMTPPPVKVTAIKNKIEVYQPKRLRDADVIQELKKIPCDYIVVAAYGQILPIEILQYAPCINLHASILPAYRGASPIQQTLLNGDSQTGVTAMLMDEGLDTGDILKIKTIDVSDDEMVEELFERLTKVAADLIVNVLENFSSLKPIKQDESKSSYCKKISKADGEVSFEGDAHQLYNRYRAFTPWPGVYLSTGLKLKKISLENTVKEYETAGKIIEIDKKSILVSCSKGNIRVFNVQPQSKKEMDIISYINGKRVALEDNLS